MDKSTSEATLAVNVLPCGDSGMFDVPTVTAVTVSPATGDLGTGATVTLTLDMSAPVTVSGVPVLSLDDGGTATYAAAHSTATALAFAYTATAGQETRALGITAVRYPDHASIDGSGGAPADLRDALIGHGGATGAEIGTSTTTPGYSPDPGRAAVSGEAAGASTGGRRRAAHRRRPPGRAPITPSRPAPIRR